MKGTCPSSLACVREFYWRVSLFPKLEDYSQTGSQYHIILVACPPSLARDDYSPNGLLPLKGLGHAILGNFSIDQVVIELTEITK